VVTRDGGFLVGRYQIDNNSGTGDIVSDTPEITSTLPDQTGMTSLQIKLNVSSSSITNFYSNWYIKITSGSNNNQVRKILTYNGTTKIASLSSAWTTQNPAIGVSYALYSNIYVASVYNETNDEWVIGTTDADPESDPINIKQYVPLHVKSVIAEDNISVNSNLNTLNGNYQINGTNIITSSRNLQNIIRYDMSDSITDQLTFRKNHRSAFGDKKEKNIKLQSRFGSTVLAGFGGEIDFSISTGNLGDIDLGFLRWNLATTSSGGRGDISIFSRPNSTDPYNEYRFRGDGIMLLKTIGGINDPLNIVDNLNFENNEGIRWGSTNCQIIGNASNNNINITSNNLNISNTLITTTQAQIISGSSPPLFVQRNAPNTNNVSWNVMEICSNKPSLTIGDGMGIAMIFSNDENSSNKITHGQITTRTTNSEKNTCDFLISPYNTGTPRNFIFNGKSGHLTMDGTLFSDTITSKSTNTNLTLSANGSGIVQVNDSLNLSSGSEYRINATSVLSSTTLGSSVVNSSLTSIGTLTGLTVSGTPELGGNLRMTAANTVDTIPANGKIYTRGIIIDSKGATNTYEGDEQYALSVRQDRNSAQGCGIFVRTAWSIATDTNILLQLENHNAEVFSVKGDRICYFGGNNATISGSTGNIVSDGSLSIDTITSKSTNTNLVLSGNGSGIVQVNDRIDIISSASPPMYIQRNGTTANISYAVLELCAKKSSNILQNSLGTAIIFSNDSFEVGQTKVLHAQITTRLTDNENNTADLLISPYNTGSVRDFIFSGKTGNLTLDGAIIANTITSKTSNTNLVLSGNGSGIVQVNDRIDIISSSSPPMYIQRNGTTANISYAVLELCAKKSLNNLQNGLGTAIIFSNDSFEVGQTKVLHAQITTRLTDNENNTADKW
jgi:hypothetical protein